MSHESGVIEKITFPYGLRETIRRPVEGNPLAVFFGTDFYNLPEGSDHTRYANETNRMLAYMRERLPGHEFIYLPHPNEKDEARHLDLTGFSVGPHTIADLFLTENANRVRAVFSTCSWASASAFAMGFPAAVFLDLLKGSIPDDAIEGYRSYFHGFPDSFFIRSYDQALPEAHAVTEDVVHIVEALLPAKTVWFLINDPAHAVRARRLAALLRERGVRSGLVRIEHPRWSVIDDAHPDTWFDEVHSVPNIRYTARPKDLGRLRSVVDAVRTLPVTDDDAIVSFSFASFPENVLLSKYPRARKVVFIESRWHYFNYENERGGLPSKDFRILPGVRAFNHIVEPLLGLHQTRYEEHRDGKVLNIHRYLSPLEDVFDVTFVLSPVPVLRSTISR